jgi:flagellar motor switch protein FliG
MVTGPEKAVLFMLSLDEEIAAPIVAQLAEADLRRLRAVASTMRYVHVDSLEDAYKDFVERVAKDVAVPHGGLSYLRRLAASSLGEDRARELFEDGVESPLARLEAAPPDAVAALLASEPPQLASALLSRLPPQQAARVLVSMGEERQMLVLQRVGRMAELPAGALEDVARALAGELPSFDADATVSVDGIVKAADILKSVGRAASTAILERLDQEDTDLAKSIRMQMFTFEDLARVAGNSMRLILREVPTERLTLALKNAPEDVLEAIFNGLSQRAAELIRDDLSLLGSVRKAEVEAARSELVQAALRLEAAGSVDLGRGDE